MSDIERLLSRPVLSVAETARLLGVTGQTVINMCRRGALDYLDTNPGGKKGKLLIVSASLRERLGMDARPDPSDQ